MTPSLFALIGLAVWTLTLLAGIALLRMRLTLTGKRAANAFAVNGDDVSPFSARLCRAHANCCENIGVLAAIIAAAVLSGASHVTDPLAPWLLAARVAQSVTHLVSTSNAAVTLRFVFFGIQLGIQFMWVAQLLLK
jgi:uncharacterized MAPEG superfamily protein